MSLDQVNSLQVKKQNKGKIKTGHKKGIFKKSAVSSLGRKCFEREKNVVLICFARFRRSIADNMLISSTGVLLLTSKEPRFHRCSNQVDEEISL